MEMSEVFTPSPIFPLDHFVIEWTAEIWENTPAMYAAMEAKGKPYPCRHDILEQPFALHACLRVHPEDSPKHYHLEAADNRYYEKIILDRLVNAGLNSVAQFLNWHYERDVNQGGFIHYVEKLIETDSDRLTLFDHLVLETKSRSFEKTEYWLELKRNIPAAAVPSNAENDRTEKRLTHRAYMLMLILMDVPKQLRGADQNKQGAVLTSLLGLNERKTYDIMFSGKDKDNPYDFKVVKELHNFCEFKEILNTPLGIKVEKLWSEAQAKRIQDGEKKYADNE